MAVEEVGEVRASGVADGQDGDAGDEQDSAPGREAALAAVAAMHRRGEELREREVERAVRELGDELDETERAAIERLGRRLVGGVLAPPTAGLLDGDDERVETALELFGEGDDPLDGPGATVQR